MRSATGPVGYAAAHAGPAWVILPTYNEAENLEPLVRAVLRRAARTSRVLVVDDSSPDGTGRDRRRARGRATTTSRCCTGRASPGSGRAYVAGFEHALRAGAGTVVEMDADFSHDPADLPRLLERAAGGRRPRARLALRAGRRASSDWDLLRRGASRASAASTRDACSASTCAT